MNWYSYLDLKHECMDLSRVCMNLKHVGIHLKHVCIDLKHVCIDLKHVPRSSYRGSEKNILYVLAENRYTWAYVQGYTCRLRHKPGIKRIDTNIHREREQQARVFPPQTWADHTCMCVGICFFHYQM
jgi:hypothetical protein